MPTTKAIISHHVDIIVHSPVATLTTLVLAIQFTRSCSGLQQIPLGLVVRPRRVLRHFCYSCASELGSSARIQAPSRSRTMKTLTVLAERNVYVALTACVVAPLSGCGDMAKLPV